MDDVEQRLKALEGELRKLKPSGVREWLQTLAPYVGGLVVLLVGFWIKDSVTLALQREQLDLQYVQQLRDLIKDFDKADGPVEANANAIALAMYGKFAVIPLVERLEAGDVVAVAAERGLLLAGTEHSADACPKFIEVIHDRAHRFRWQTHKTMIRVIGQSACVAARAELESYRAALQPLKPDEAEAARGVFAKRYSQEEGFDGENVTALIEEIDRALEILSLQVKT